jgi:hypothetical protein
MDRIPTKVRDIMTAVFHGFLHSLEANAGIVHLLVHDRFLPNTFQFIIIDSLSLQPKPCSVDTGCVARYFTNMSQVPLLNIYRPV